MNKARRALIDDLIEKLETIKETLDSIRDEEEDAFYNLPDSLHYSEKGEAMEEAITNLDDAMTNIDDAIDFLTEATN